MPRRPFKIFHQLIAVVAISLAALQPTAHGKLGVTPPDQFRVPEGFEVQLVYEVPSREQGSWVSLTVDPQGRLVACDQDGALYRIDVSQDEAKVEKLDAAIQSAQGLLFAFDSLYVNVNGRDQSKNGVYRLQDTNGDDQFDKIEHILPLQGGGEHGPHALILSQDGSRLITCGGNMTKLPASIERSRVPQVWDEDHLLGRMPDARGHASDRMAPGGWIGSFAPDGSDFELIASGFRNEYDIALNRKGELFTYDADMEWDVGTPWYRPTRVNHVVSGGEFGWRNGTGKWPAYYPDSFGAAVNIGPGSPTGICFGYGAKFPAKYQNALFIADWSYGNIHAVQLTPEGSSYTGTFEVFATAAPLPVTDLAIRPQDGALYFAIGGRQTQSGLYRIVYTGDESTAAAQDTELTKQQTRLVNLRHRLEAFHVGEPKKKAISVALKQLGSKDRGVRFAARIALEHQGADAWKGQIAELESDQARALAVVALARTGKPDDQSLAFETLQACDWSGLSDQGKIDLLRAYGLTAIRLGQLNDDQRSAVAKQIAGQFPSGNDNLDRELAQMLVYVDAKDASRDIIDEMESAPSQENQIFYALILREASGHWDEAMAGDYFAWFRELQSARGGMSFGGFINNIKNASLEHLDPALKDKLAEVINPPKVIEESAEPRALVKQWTVDELLPAVEQDKTPDFDNGAKVFATAQCYKCHRMGIQGGILGPDLTGAGGRFSPKDLLTSIIHPDQVISDQYGATQFLTEDGRIIVGRVVNMHGTRLQVMTNMLDPSSLTSVDRNSVEETRASKTSMMPAGLLDTFTEDEIADLVAYLRAGGNQSHPIYRNTTAQK
ncbi:c-type cytochrome [Rhodopirellula sp. MGV]|uniref:c-type cytochrome n=1 Tax=Rhodopirellula sp. MGV TaxID=2023130 RepID=UPI000B96F8FB|nr:c-type cytochrome [Rhodopirellula sp. MGV]OYP38842.1 L-sorbosone dehydrogenase [Rhodopirellula sp. MGV]PNY37652.1 L-sorbosone dehydrogenase [Rhodopirellula baltica]